jgi:prepilin-type N-terminal cleavage/methylation domain-containing protein
MQTGTKMISSKIKSSARDGRSAFTLIELLTVIAIIGILAGIIIPTVGAVKISANKSKTKAQFSQWAVAMGLFKQEYGYYPQIGVNDKIDHDRFFAALTGKTYTGAVASPLHGNTKKLSFYSASDSEVTSTANGDAVSGRLKDAFGNTDIAVFVDSNGDGVIKDTDSPALKRAPVTPIDGTARTPATTAFSTSTGVRGGVIFYSAGKGTTDSDIVYSW